MFRNPLLQPAGADAVTVTVEDVSDESNLRVFLDISINGGPAERMVIELFANVVSKTAEKFRALCTGEKGISKTTGKPLHYKGFVFNSINKGLYAQAADPSNGKERTYGESIYGGYFEDENFQLLHTERGLLSMANRGANTNGSKFHITFAPFSLLDRFNVVFGKVMQGMSTLSHINEMGRRNSRKPSREIRITDCGQIPQDKVEDVSDESNPRVFLDISIGESSPERLVIELFANVVPRTAENFRAYCAGEKGISKTTGRPLHYKGTVFDHIVRGAYAHGGDFSEGEDFTGGESIYGGCFEDENSQLRHTEPGLLSIRNGGPNTNGSRFHLTFAPVKWFDGLCSKSHVVFGKVIQGMSTIKRMSQIGTEDKGKKKESLKRKGASAVDDPIKEHADDREKQWEYSSSPIPGLLQISETAETSEDIERNNVESDLGKNEKSLETASSCDERVKEHSDERIKRRKGFSSVGQCGEISEDTKNDLIQSDQGSGKNLSSRQIEWIRDIASVEGLNIPEYLVS